MKRFQLGKTMSLVALSVGPLLATSALADVNYGPGGAMMGGWGGSGWMSGGGYGGPWMLILLVVVIAAVLAWIVSQKKK